jgi:hypothetical protein
VSSCVTEVTDSRSFCYSFCYSLCCAFELLPPSLFQLSTRRRRRCYLSARPVLIYYHHVAPDRSASHSGRSPCCSKVSFFGGGVIVSGPIWYLGVFHNNISLAVLGYIVAVVGHKRCKLCPYDKDDLTGTTGTRCICWDGDGIFTI